MIKLLKKFFQKKSVFIVIFVIVTFICGISKIEAKGKVEGRLCPEIPSEFFNDMNDTNRLLQYTNDSYDKFITLKDYYDTYLSSEYDIYVANSNQNGLQYFFYIKSEWLVDDPAYEIVYNAYDTGEKTIVLFLRLKNNRRPNIIYLDNYGNVKTSTGPSGYLNINISQYYRTDLTDYYPFLATNFNSKLKLISDTYSSNCKTVPFKDELWNIGDYMMDSFPPISQSYIFNLDGDVFKNDIYKGLIFYFKRPEDGILKFKFDLIENDEDKPSFDFVPAFDLSFLNLSETLEKIKNCEYNPDGFGGCFTAPGGSFGGGGGGGRFGDEDDYCGVVDFTTLPEIVTQMTSEYGMFYMLACENHKKMAPSDFKTTQIKITTNAQIFLTYKELEEEFITNPPDWFDWDDSEFDYDDDKLKQPTSLFKIVNQYLVDNREVINEIGKTIDELFQGLNHEIKNFVIAIYSLLILSAIAIMIRK